MHASSYENMEKFYHRFGRDLIAARGRVRLLDVGGANVNGTYRPIFQNSAVEYLTVDLQPGPDVDICTSDPSLIPLPDGFADLVLSGQMLEHCEFFWITFKEMVRVLRPGGLICLIAPSAGPIHRFPVDCYRFYPDSYHALAKVGGCELLQIWHDERGAWNDLVGVFWKPDDSSARPAPNTAPPQLPADVLPPEKPGLPAEERRAGKRPYLDVLADLHDSLRPPLYLEIGVRDGDSLKLAQGMGIGVDPFPSLRATNHDQRVHLVAERSDDFFERTAHELISCPLSLTFIDGLHLFDQVLRDFMNVERFSTPASLCIIDDVFPNHPAQATRPRVTNVWTGDVWKLMFVLNDYRPDLNLVRLDTEPTGMLLVAGLDPNSRTLQDSYNQIVRDSREAMPTSPPGEVLTREGALSASAWQIRFLGHLFRTLRDRGMPSSELQRWLVRVVRPRRRQAV